MTDRAIAWVRQQSALTPDRPFFMYFAPGATHAPHHVPLDWADRYKGQFDDGWDALRERIFARAEAARRRAARRRAHGPPRRDPGLGRHARRAQAGPGPPDGGVRRLPRAHRPPRRPADRRDRRAGRADEHARLLHRRRQRGVGRGPHQRQLQRVPVLQRRRGAGDPRVPGGRASTSSARRRPTTTSPWAGRMRWTRPTSGPSRSPRTGAARATARSSTGREGIAAKGEVRDQFHHVIDVAPTVLEAAGIPAPEMVNGVPQMPVHGVSMGYSFDDAPAPRPSPHAVLRDRRQPRHLPRGLDGRHEARDAVDRHGRAAGLRRRRVGAVLARRLDAVPRPLRRRCPTSCASCRRCSSRRRASY